MTRTTPRPAWRAGLLAATVGAGVLTAGSGGSASALAGDTATGSGYAFTARLDIGGGKRACSGTLVDPSWVLTAASCFADNPAVSTTVEPGAPKDATTVTVGRNDVTATGGHTSTVVQLVPRTDRDLVMARLAQPATGITPLVVGGTAPVQGEDLYVAGFGRTGTVWANDALHTSTFTVGAVKPAGFDVAAKAPAGATVCKGDAGGPVVRPVNGQLELAAVTSRSWQGGCLGTPATETRTGAYDTRIDDLGQWIENTRHSTPTGRTVVGNPFTIVDPTDGHLVTYVRDSGNHLNAVDPQGEGWLDLGPMAAADPTAVVNPADHHVVVHVNGPDNRLWSYDAQGAGWVEFTKTGSGTVLAPDAVPQTVVDPADGHLVTYVRDTANHLWSVDPQGEGWVDFGPMAATDPFTVVNPVNNHLVTYVNGPDNRLFSVDPQGAGWTQFTKTGSGTVLAPDAVPQTVVDPADGHLVTYVRDTANHLWSVDPQGEGWVDFGPMAATDPFTVVNPVNNHLVTYVNGPDNRLFSVDPQGAGWTQFTRTLSDTALAGRPFTLADPADQHLTTYVRDTRGTLWSVDPAAEGWVRFHGGPSVP